ncbi:MAG: hypothetical protein CVU98_11270 [Firmicutes bacterium HGW-Firmicutes-3]|jgi:subtilisin family serine protease|nr:MAG: hypothetical protein CVU98_11270 [Firmicutes bacterium HGW-Firmicutes-3]
MKKKLLVILLLCSSLTLFSCSSQPDSNTAYKDPSPESIIYSEQWGNVPVNQIVVVFENGVDKPTATKVLKQLGGTVVAEQAFINLYQVETEYTTESALLAGIEIAKNLDGVEFVFPNVEIYNKEVKGTPCSPLKDPIFEDERNAAHYKMIGMENAWNIIKGSGINLNPVNVAVLDSAIYTGSDEFNGNVKLSGDKTDEPQKNDNIILNSGLSHGTMVTHVIGANHENSGMVGIASVLEDKLSINVKNLFDDKESYEETEINEDDSTQKVYETNGKAYTLKALAYLKEQVDSGATVINCSFGPVAPSDNNEWVSKAYEKFFTEVQKTNPNVLFVAAAGNEANADKSKGALNGKNYYPAGLNLPNIITVGAVNTDGSRANFSNFATEDAEVTLSAPGVNMVVGVDKDGKPVTSSGTSYATPQVTSAIALIQSINPNLSAAEIKDSLIKTSAPGIIGTDQSIPIPEGMGAGVLQVDQAVLQAINDLRKQQNLAPYTMDELLDMSRITLTAEGVGKEFNLTSHIPSAFSGQTDVKITVNGQHALTGDSTQNVASGSDANWGILLVDDSVFIRVSRADNGGCAYLTLKPADYDLAGTWSGMATLVEETMGEDVEADKSAQITLSINSDGSGTATVEWVTAPITVSSDFSSISFAISESAYGLTSTGVFDGSVMEGEQGLTMSGTATFTITGINGSAVYTWYANQLN